MLPCRIFVIALLFPEVSGTWYGGYGGTIRGVLTECTRKRRNPEARRFVEPGRAASLHPLHDVPAHDIPLPRGSTLAAASYSPASLRTLGKYLMRWPWLVISVYYHIFGTFIPAGATRRSSTSRSKMNLSNAPEHQRDRGCPATSTENGEYVPFDKIKSLFSILIPTVYK